MHYVYAIQSLEDNKWYTGVTSDLRNRFKQHQAGEVFSTKSRGPFKLIYYEAGIHPKDARARELFLKSGLGKHYLKKRLNIERAISPRPMTYPTEHFHCSYQPI